MCTPTQTCTLTLARSHTQTQSPPSPHTPTHQLTPTFTDKNIHTHTPNLPRHLPSPWDTHRALKACVFCLSRSGQWVTCECPKLFTSCHLPQRTSGNIKDTWQRCHLRCHHSAVYVVFVVNHNMDKFDGSFLEGQVLWGNRWVAFRCNRCIDILAPIFLLNIWVIFFKDKKRKICIVF